MATCTVSAKWACFITFRIPECVVLETANRTGNSDGFYFQTLCNNVVFLSELAHGEKDKTKYIEVSNFNADHLASELKHYRDLDNYTEIVLRKENNERISILHPHVPAPITLKNLENDIKGIGM